MRIPPNLGLGTAQFGEDYGIANLTGRVDEDEARRILELCRDRGIRLIDTAMSYQGVEELLGEVGIAGCDVVTKLPGLDIRVRDVEDWVIRSVEVSLHRLGVDRLYGLLLHRPSDLYGDQGRNLRMALEKVRDLGLTTKLGISIYEPSELDQLLENFSFQLVQAPFNLVDRRMQTTGWIPKLTALGIELHVRSIFLQGLLLMPPSDRPERFKRWQALWDRWGAWLHENERTALEACVGFVMDTPGIDRVIVGVDRVEQLEDIIAAAPIEMPARFPDISSDELDLVIPSLWGPKR